MKKAVIFFLLSFPCLIFGQGTSIDKIEQEIRPHVPDGIRLDKLATDLNGDGKEDLIYSYECAEGLICIRIYLQINGEYVKQLDTARGPYTLETFSGDKKLQLTESCCGEGLFRLYQTYRFDQTSIRLVENYIVKSVYYTEGRMITPPSIREKPYYVKSLNDNYNLRFSPDMKAFSGDFMFTCQPNTNIIATIKTGARLKVLAERPEEDRTWLYVEVEEKDIKDRCHVADFDEFSFAKDHGNPSVRGWVSGRYTEKE